MNRIHLRVGERLRALICGLMIVIAVGAILQAKDKGDKDFKDAQAAAAKLDWDTALELYLKALDKNPNNMAYTIGMRRARFQSGQMHVNKGQKLRTDGKVEEAMGEFQKALIADPSSSIAIQEMKRTQAILDERKNGGKPVNPSEANMTAYERARLADDRKLASIEAPPELKPVVGTIPPIKMNNQPPKVMFETIGKMAGLNVVFDPQYTAPSRNANVDISTNTPVEEAFDYLAMLTHTYWKPISSNTIFVTEDNVTKRRDYEDQVVKVFYVTNVTSVQEFQEIATAIRTVAEIRRAFTYNAQKAIIVRGTADAVELAGKMIHDLDKPKSEVLIDVVVMEVSSQYSRSLAATIASNGTAGLSQSISFLPTTTSTGTTTTTTDPTTGTTTTTTTPSTTSGTTSSTTNGTISLSQLGHLSINQFSTSLPGALLNAVMSDARTKTLNKPQVRASDGMKVELTIGQRIPYATGSFSSGVSVSSSVSPLVSTQFNYADVGLKLNITPQVHSTSEVTLHVEVEVSEVDQYVNIGGISQPVIGQSKNTADVRLRDGEVNLLSSLSQNSDSSTVGGLPGLTNIPILGSFLFGSSSKNRTSSELMIALIPHIIRTPDYSAENVRGIYAGSDQVVKLYYEPKTDEVVSTPPPVANPAAMAPAAAPPATAPTPTPTAPAVIPGMPQLGRPAPPVAPTAPMVAAGNAKLRFAPDMVDAALGGPVQVSLLIDNAADLFTAAPIRIKYDPKLLKLNDITPGDLFTKDGVHVTSVKDIRNELGEAVVTVSRAQGATGVAGSGAVLMLNFTAIGRGEGSVTLPELELRNAKLQPLAIAPAQLTVKVH